MSISTKLDSNYEISIFATITLIGPKLSSVTSQILANHVRQRVAPQLEPSSKETTRLLFSASPLSFEDILPSLDGSFGTAEERKGLTGVVLRIAGDSIELVRTEVISQLSKLREVVDDDIWSGRGNG